MTLWPLYDTCPCSCKGAHVKVLVNVIEVNSTPWGVCIPPCRTLKCVCLRDDRVVSVWTGFGGKWCNFVFARMRMPLLLFLREMVIAWVMHVYTSKSHLAPAAALRFGRSGGWCYVSFECVILNSVRCVYRLIVVITWTWTLNIVKVTFLWSLWTYLWIMTWTLR
jgi:hypothetical protein